MDEVDDRVRYVIEDFVEELGEDGGVEDVFGFLNALLDEVKEADGLRPLNRSLVILFHLLFYHYKLSY